MPTDAERSAILDTIDREVAAMAQGDMNAFGGVLAADAVFLPPNTEAKAGADLRTWLGTFLRDFAVEWLRFEHGDVAADGILGFHTYEYEWRVTPRGGGASTIGHGKGLHVLRRQADGAWKILREVWNASPAS
jgi:ketosteroid isomerase-like protein